MGLEAGVGMDVSICNDSTSISGEESNGDALLLLAFSWVFSASMSQMSDEEDGMTLKSLVVSIGTSACLHNYVKRTENGREVSFCLALMAISCDVTSRRSMFLLYKILVW